MSFDWRPFVYGGLASMTAELGTFPVDTTKTRLQIQGQQLGTRHRELRYRGMIHGFIRIAKEEGVAALYSGIRPALLRQATYGTIKIGVYNSLKRAFAKTPQDETLAFNVACGVVAGVVSSAIANPTDVLKVRMQADSANDATMWRAFNGIYHAEGRKGLWRGVMPTSQRAAIVAGVELPVYDISKKHIIQHGVLGDSIITHFIASVIAGFAGAVASTPVDVVKTRLMNQRALKTAVVVGEGTASVQAIYTSSLDCLAQTVKNEGMLALYKGFIPTWVRLGPWNIIFFLSFEQMKNFY